MNGAKSARRRLPKPADAAHLVHNADGHAHQVLADDTTALQVHAGVPLAPQVLAGTRALQVRTGPTSVVVLLCVARKASPKLKHKKVNKKSKNLNVENWLSTAVPTTSTPTKPERDSVNIKENIAANHKNSRGLLLKVSCLEKNVAYYKSESTAAEYKYEVMKSKFRQERKAHKTSNAKHEATIAQLTQQVSCLMMNGAK